VIRAAGSAHTRVTLTHSFGTLMTLNVTATLVTHSFGTRVTHK